MSNVRILLLGEEDWREQYSIPQNINIEYQDELTEYDGYPYDIVILDKNLSYKEKDMLLKCSKTYCFFVTENVRMSKNAQYVFECRMGKVLETKDINDFLLKEARNYGSSFYGRKLSPEQLSVNQLFKGSVELLGKYNLHISGDYGMDFSQIAYWKENFVIRRGQKMDLFFEYSKSEKVELMLRIILLEDSEKGNIHKIWEFSGVELSDSFQISNIYQSGIMFVSIHAKGSGDINIKSFHIRPSKGKIGFFVPGGSRMKTSSGEELFYYYDPGDMNPPLNVFFADFKKREAFTEYQKLKKLGTPTLLIMDTRMECGAFYIGDNEYEKMISSIIQDCLKKLDFDRNAVIMGGTGMGAYGAVYYACEFKPTALVIGKPIVNLGDMALYEKSFRPGIFPESLDILMKNCGELTPENVENFNSRLWEKFDKAIWSDVIFAIAYMQEDEYDPNAYEDFLLHLARSNAQIFGKSIYGRHDDESVKLDTWLYSQYMQILHKFGRKN